MTSIKRPTIRDVARVSGVSPMTVSHVLNDRSEKVGAQTRERVRRVIEELHYRPSAIARGLSRKRLDAIGVVFYTRTPSRLVAQAYHGDLLGGILEAATTRGQSTTLFSEIGFDHNHERLNVYCDGRCDGLIFVAPPTPSKLIAAMPHTSVPYVMVGELSENNEWTSIDVDNVKAAKVAVETLLSFGHRRIALLLGNEKRSSTHLREKGYRLALAEASIAADPSLVMPGMYTEESGFDRTIELMSRGENAPTALFCVSDDIAFGALGALSELGTDIPGDVSVIGFDDNEAATRSNPPLTTMHQPLYLIGSMAVEMLLEQIIDGMSPGRTEILSAELKLRSSVGPVRAGRT